MCVCVIFFSLYTYCTSFSESVTLTLEALWQKWAQTLSRSAAVWIRQQVSVILHTMTNLNIFKWVWSSLTPILLQSCRYLRLNMLSVTFHICVCSVDGKPCLWDHLHRQSLCGLGPLTLCNVTKGPNDHLLLYLLTEQRWWEKMTTHGGPLNVSAATLPWQLTTKHGARLQPWHQRRPVGATPPWPQRSGHTRVAKSQTVIYRTPAGPGGGLSLLKDLYCISSLQDMYFCYQVRNKPVF